MGISNLSSEASVVDYTAIFPLAPLFTLFDDSVQPGCDTGLQSDSGLPPLIFCEAVAAPKISAMARDYDDEI
jgi:hypothetical protein